MTCYPAPALPLIEELVPPPDAEDVFLRLARRPHCLFLDSALRHPTLGRYSFLAADPFDYLEHPADGGDALQVLADRMAGFTAAVVPGLPPFQGGAAGLFSYDLGRSLERLPSPAVDEFHVPALAVGFYDVVLAVDHAAGRAWSVSHGGPETAPSRRCRRAAERLGQFRQWLAEPAGDRPIFAADDFSEIATFSPRKSGRTPLQLSPRKSGKSPPEYPLAGVPGVTSNFSRVGYLRAVQRAIDYIYAGDVFQVNLAQRLLAPAREASPALYRRLRRCNPAPFAGYLDLGEYQILSASPERFMQVSEGRVETRPIKGTRPRSLDPTADRAAAAELLASEKDRAENTMIVDLLRNDLSRVCEAESVCVGRLCGLEAYQYVWHLVSAVHGRLRKGRTAIDLLRASFPGGSVTGAPKVRAMEIIAEIEPTARGAYCGALGYLGFNGAADLNILIRTITAGRGFWQFPVGGGIVAQSTPEREYQETLDKAEGLLRALAVDGAYMK